MMNQVANAETADSTYQTLYKIGGVAALIAAALILGDVIVLAIYPQPSTISDWFMLFQSNKIVGLLDLWGTQHVTAQHRKLLRRSRQRYVNVGLK